MKKITVNSKELVGVLKKVKGVNERIKDIHQVLVDADKKHKKLQFEVQRYKDKGAKILDKVLLKEYEMEEFDYSGEMDALTDNEVQVTIMNFFDDNYGDLAKVREKMREDRKNKVGVWKEPLMYTGCKDV